MKLIKKNTSNRTNKLRKIYKIIAWCSGVRLYLLEKCPTDYNKYFGIGAIVLMTGVFAAISGGYALYTVFDKIWIAFFFSILWGLMIFFLDWYIVSSLKKEDKFYKEFISALPRIILAVLIAIVISKPLELKLFEKEINKELLKINSEKTISQNKFLNNQYQEIDILKKENEKLKNEIKQKENKRDKLFNMIIEEAEGRSITNKIGKGQVYREKKKEFEKIEIELQNIKTINNKKLNKNEKIINNLQIDKMKKLKNNDAIIHDVGGFLGRIKALKRLSKENKSVNNASNFIVFLFIIIEASPMIVKLMSRKGVYDYLLNFEEKKEFSQFTKKIAGIELNMETEIDAIIELSEMKNEKKTDTEKKYINSVFETKQELDLLKIKLWKEKEKNTIYSIPDKYIEDIENIIKA